MKTGFQKRILITGAGSGLGQAFALEYARMGWKVGVADVIPERVKETVDLVNGKGGNGLAAVCDVSKVQDLIKLAEMIKTQWGGLDILVNNAGIAMGGRLDTIPAVEIEKILRINLEGAIHGCRVFIPMMKAQRSGYIVNTASLAGFACLPEMSLYNITKAGIIALSESLRSELSPFNIGVSVIAPPFFQTRLLDGAFFSTKNNREFADREIARSKLTSEKIVQVTIKGIKKNRFYILPNSWSYFVWLAKRFFPKNLLKIVAYLYKTKVFKAQIDS